MIAIRPPEYFPRSAYISLMQHADHFVLADTFQYSRQSFQNRSKLRNPNGWQWITVPLQGYAYGEPIHRVKIDHDNRWKERHWRSFMYNYRSTMYFEYYEDRFRPMFDEEEWPTLADLTCRSVEVEAKLMQIDTPIIRASELNGAPASVDDILATMDAEGESLLCLPDTAAVNAKTGRDVHVLQFDLEPYRQNFEGFEAEMSAMDFAFNYGPDAAVRIADAGTIQPYADTA
ncbi:hypothetical protein CRI94_01510 [Longibacter salinarum]|uniref:WbqC family protein n=1 Tax=Longibacter salinarum TaxID=1850348 RepID=A0A2A8D249_9BACT|nr:WbqC family protein [Longibacter salinarum]PEN14996.1 hypothetical protein CRI94_01510 [Longibacter salinarum]